MLVAKMDLDGLDFERREVVLRADLRGHEERDCVWTPLRFLMRGPRPPRPGERVLLVDRDGGSCLGQVTAVSGWEACVRPDWSTWERPGATLHN
jgi:hypothetical protein